MATHSLPPKLISQEQEQEEAKIMTARTAVRRPAAQTTHLKPAHERFYARPQAPAQAPQPQLKRSPLPNWMDQSSTQRRAQAPQASSTRTTQPSKASLVVAWGLVMALAIMLILGVGILIGKSMVAQGNQAPTFQAPSVVEMAALTSAQQAIKGICSLQWNQGQHQYQVVCTTR